MLMKSPRVLVLTGYGINCDEETKFAFDRAGGKAEIVHVNDLVDGHRKMPDYQIFVFPGGFSYGDDTGSGNALANKVRNHLWEEMRSFVEKDNLVLGICNGFQVMVNLGLLPAMDHAYGDRQVALVHNDGARYLDRWVDLQFGNRSPWTKGLGTISVPIAHGEGKLYVPSDILLQLQQSHVAARYVEGEACAYQNLRVNPNGSLDDIAALQDESGRVLGMMPHPERAIDFTQLPNWPLIKEQLKRQGLEIPEEGPGMQLFRNAVAYFR